MNFLHSTLLLIFIKLLLSPSSSYSASILGFSQVYSKSHNNLYQIIMKALAARGHNVTFISFFKSASSIPNYTEIAAEIKGINSYVDSIAVDKAYLLCGSLNLIPEVIELELLSCHQFMKLDYIQRMINSKEKQVDLIVAEVYHFQCYNLLAEVLDVPVIGLLPQASYIGDDFMIGNPKNPSYVPILTTPHTTKMNFLQRLENLNQYLQYYIMHYYLVNSYMKDVAKLYFNMTLPSVDVLQKRVQLTLVNNHPSFISKENNPNVINIGGIHIQEPKSLPVDVLQFIEGAKHGVILFSFGTTINASSIPSEKLDILRSVFSQIPQRILWRTNNLALTNLPPNVKTANWFPQRDILEHKNVRVFISHCGIFSTFEAIYTGTPVIAVPFLFDQFQNANILIEKGAGIYIDYDTFSEQELMSAINNIVNDTKYAENMKNLSEIFKDRPMKPLDTALFWIEYVVRHKGAAHLRPTGADMPLYRYLLLDVLAFMLIVLIGFLWLCKWMLKLAFFSVLGIRNRLFWKRKKD